MTMTDTIYARGQIWTRWHGGNKPPSDWNGGRVLLADNTILHPYQEDVPFDWAHDTSETGCIEPGCIVGYTSSEPTTWECGDIGKPLCSACDVPTGDLTQYPGCGASMANLSEPKPAPEPVDAGLVEELTRLHNEARGAQFDLVPADGPIARLTLFMHEHGDKIIAALAKLAPEPDYIELPSKPSDFNCVLGDVEAEIRGQLGDKFKHLAPIVAAEYRRQQALAEIRSALTIKEPDHD